MEWLYLYYVEKALGRGAGRCDYYNMAHGNGLVARVLAPRQPPSMLVAHLADLSGLPS